MENTISTTSSPISRQRRRAAKLARIRKQRAELLKLEKELGALKENSKRIVPTKQKASPLAASTSRRIIALSPKRISSSSSNNSSRNGSPIVIGGNTEHGGKPRNSPLQPSPKRFNNNSNNFNNMIKKKSSSPRHSPRPSPKHNRENTPSPSPAKKLNNSRGSTTPIRSIGLTKSTTPKNNAKKNSSSNNKNKNGKKKTSSSSVLSAVKKQLNGIDDILLSPKRNIKLNNNNDSTDMNVEEEEEGADLQLAPPGPPPTPPSIRKRKLMAEAAIRREKKEEEERKTQLQQQEQFRKSLNASIKISSFVRGYLSRTKTKVLKEYVKENRAVKTITTFIRRYNAMTKAKKILNKKRNDQILQSELQRSQKASTLICANIRGYLQRKDVKLGIKIQAATKIGKTMRMYLAKSRYEILKRERTLRRKFDENCAATRINSLVRGFITRQRLMKDYVEPSSPVATKLLQRKHLKEIELSKMISVNVNDEEDSNMVLNKNESSPYASRLLRRKIQFQDLPSFRLDDVSLNASSLDENESSPIASRLLRRKHQVQEYFVNDTASTMENGAKFDLNENESSPIASRLLRRKHQVQEYFVNDTASTMENGAKFDLNENESSPIASRLQRRKFEKENGSMEPLNDFNTLRNESSPYAARIQRRKFQRVREIDESLDNFKLDPEPQEQEMNIKTEQQIYANVSSPLSTALLKRKHEINKLKYTGEQEVSIESKNIHTSSPHSTALLNRKHEFYKSQYSMKEEKEEGPEQETISNSSPNAAALLKRKHEFNNIKYSMKELDLNQGSVTEEINVPVTEANVSSPYSTSLQNRKFENFKIRSESNKTVEKVEDSSPYGTSLLEQKYKQEDVRSGNSSSSSSSSSNNNKSLLEQMRRQTELNENNNVQINEVEPNKVITPIAKFEINKFNNPLGKRQQDAKVALSRRRRLIMHLDATNANDADAKQSLVRQSIALTHEEFNNRKDMKAKSTVEDNSLYLELQKQRQLLEAKRKNKKAKGNQEKIARGREVLMNIFGNTEGKNDCTKPFQPTSLVNESNAQNVTDINNVDTEVNGNSNLDQQDRMTAIAREEKNAYKEDEALKVEQQQQQEQQDQAAPFSSSLVEEDDSYRLAVGVMTFDMTQPDNKPRKKITSNGHINNKKNNDRRHQEVMTFDMHDEFDGMGPEARKLKMEDARRRKLARLRRRTEQHRRRRELRMKDRELKAKQQMEKDARIKDLQSHDMMGIVGSHWNVEDEIKDTDNRAYEAWENVEREVMSKPEEQLIVDGTSNGYHGEKLDGLIPLSEIQDAIIHDVIPNERGNFSNNSRGFKSRRHNKNNDEEHPSLLRQPSATLQQQRQAALKAASHAKPGIGVSQKRAMVSTARQYGPSHEEQYHGANDTNVRQASTTTTASVPTRSKNRRRKLKGPSNRKKVCLALKNVCLAGAHLFDEHSDARNSIGESSSENFLILMGKKEKLTYGGLYAINPATKDACLIHGAGPDMLEQRMVSGYFKYSTSTRSFTEIGGTKTFTATTDAITLKPEFLKKRIRRKTQMNLDYRSKVMENMSRGRGIFQLN